MVFSSETYDFMNNSPTNEKTCTNVHTNGKIYKAVRRYWQTPLRPKGKMDITSFQAMKDYIKAGKGTSKTTTKLLDSIDTSLGPNMEIKLVEETIKTTGRRITITHAEDVDIYNEAVRDNNKLVDFLEGSTGQELSSPVTFAGKTYGGKQSEGDLRDLAEAIYTGSSVRVFSNKPVKL